MKTCLLRDFLVGAVCCLLAGEARGLDADLGRFSSAKQQQIRELARTMTNKVPEIVWQFFDAVRVDDWETATNLAARIKQASHLNVQDASKDATAPILWAPISETYGAYELFHDWNTRWLHRFGNEIIKSIPPGSIYFGGTDPGRFIISVLSDSQVEGRPFFTLTQNQLADSSYLDYLRVMYGKKIQIPTRADLDKAFKEYVADAQARNRQGQLKPGEDVREVNGRVQVSGAVAVMQINALIVKKILDDNPQRDFFLEVSYPLDWMNPYLEPHGLIFQLHHEPLAKLSEKIVAEDQDYWKKLSSEMLGGWLNEKTSLKELCDFAYNFGLGKHLDGYAGDKGFAENASARKTFSKLRTSIAGVYAWRGEHAVDPDERDRMYQAADLAFRQAYAMCPTLPEVIYGYAIFLSGRGRNEDAVMIAKTSLNLRPEDAQLQSLVSQLIKRE